MLYSRSKDYMFRPAVAVIRSLSFDSLKIILCLCYSTHLRLFYVLVIRLTEDYFIQS